MTKFSCIILAGGKGTRFGRKKQNVKWDETPLWQIVYNKCLKVSDDVHVVGYSQHGRQGAVYNGLRKVKYSRVVILEAARPLVTVEQIKKIGELKKYLSISYAYPSTDTIYYMKQHLKRDFTYQLQVPQAFDTEILKKAHRICKYAKFTSDTEVVFVALGISPFIITGGRNLMKVTYPEDLKILDVINNET